MNADPKVTMKMVEPPADYASGDFGAGFVLSCPNTPVPAVLGPLYDITAGVKSSIENCLTQANQILIAQGSESPIWTVEGYKSPNDLIVGKMTIPGGSLFSNEQPNGPPATVPDPVVTPQVIEFGKAYPGSELSNGYVYDCWGVNAPTTTRQPGSPPMIFGAGMSNTVIGANCKVSPPQGQYVVVPGMGNFAVLLVDGQPVPKSL